MPKANNSKNSILESVCPKTYNGKHNWKTQTEGSMRFVPGMGYHDDLHDFEVCLACGMIYDPKDNHGNQN